MPGCDCYLIVIAQPQDRHHIIGVQGAGAAVHELQHLPSMRSNELLL